MFHHLLIQLFANRGIYSKRLNSANKVVHLTRCWNEKRLCFSKFHC